MKSAIVVNGKNGKKTGGGGVKLFQRVSVSPRWNYNTPPDSPRCYTHGQYNDIIPEIDIYAIPSVEGEIFYILLCTSNLMTNQISLLFIITENQEIYFIAIIDVLTHYGVKKQVIFINNL